MLAVKDRLIRSSWAVTWDEAFLKSSVHARAPVSSLGIDSMDGGVWVGAQCTEWTSSTPILTLIKPRPTDALRSMPRFGL